MLETVPIYVAIIFILTTLLTASLFYKATRKSTTTLIIFAVWILIHSILGLNLFYTVGDVMPPRLMLAFIPTFALMFGLFLTQKGKSYIDSLDLKALTLVHIIRIPVEIVLWWLFLSGAIPELMTFEGRNFDILAGLTAPFIYYFGFVKRQISRQWILIWNIACLGLLINIIIHALLSAPFPLQQFAFDQPNIGILYFPFVLLPGFVVPVVLFSHFVAIKKLWS